VILQRRVRSRIEFTNGDRLLFILLYRWCPSVLKAMVIVRPETVMRWHRAGFRHYWHWKSRGRRGRPQIDGELRALIRRMSQENPLWGVPRIHGELRKLGFNLAQSSVAKYMVRRRGPPSQGWGTFLRNHAPDIAAVDLFVVPTLGFGLLYALVIVRLDRRKLVWVSVTTNPTAAWIARQITEAFPWDEAPRYLIRDQDGIYGATVRKPLAAMGIRDRPIARGSPWQNGYAERLGRGALATDTAGLCLLLQQSANSPILEQGCPAVTVRAAGWAPNITGHSRWLAPSIRTHLSFRYRQVLLDADLTVRLEHLVARDRFRLHSMPRR